MDISTLERAAGTLLAPPNLVSADERRQAENYFQDLKKSISMEEAMHILHQTENSFVLFEMAQAVGELTLRDWSLLDPQVVEATYKTLLEFVAARETLESYVIAEFLKTIAIIVKRGSLSGNDREDLYKFIHNLLMHQSPKLQSLGCRFISALIEQFSSAWRNSKFSITWDFHLKAKTEFEVTGLRRLLEFSLTTLHALNGQENILNDEFTKRLCEKFLEVAENILSWNFSSKLTRRFLCVNTTTNAFRPPVAWKDLLDADEFYIIFFKLHSKIRNDEDLCMKSMNCLIQLASLTGDCIPVQDPESSIRYVTLYISNLLDLFREGPLPWEVNHFCTIINRLFLYRPLSSILKLDANLRAQFFKFLTEYTLYLTRDAMSKAIGQGIHSEHTSLSVIYDAVVVLLRGRWRVTVRDEEEEQLIDNEICIQPSVRMMEEFIQCVLAPPLGTRPPCQEEDDVDDNDDRVLFNDLLTPLSQMMCYNIGHFTRSMIATLRGTSSELKQMAGSNDVSRMPTWQEDQHWLMLILANSVVGEEEDGSCHLASEVVEFSADLLKAGTVFDEEPKKAFLNMCILNPTDDRSVYDQRVNPFILLMGELLSWASLEHQLFTSASGEMISPELCRSTLFALKRFINAAGSCSSEDVNNLPLVMPKDAEFSLTLVEFVIHKVFTVLAKFSGEAKLCKDAIATLVGLVESYASVIASSSVFFDYLSNFDISQIPNRTNLMRALVLIGASANDAQLQENMFNMILAPLCQRFAELSEKPSSSDVDSGLVDLLQCFEGVARGSQSHSALVLFQFLHPVLQRCVGLMRTRAHAQAVVSTILELLLNVTTKVSIYIDEADSSRLYETLLQIIDGYRLEHTQRLVSLTECDEEKAGDLILFIEILSNVLSKDILSNETDRVSTGAQVTMESLKMLLTVMNENVVRLPEVALKFYRLILYLVEFSPEALTTMSSDLLASLCECIKLGMTGSFGNEITSTSLEALTEVAKHFSQEVNRSRVTANLVDQFHLLLPLVFETCLSFTCETSIFSEACSALYMIISFDFDFYQRFVEDLLTKKSNQAAANVIRNAFAELMPSPPVQVRRERVLFRGRMEAFLNKVQGILSYN